MHDMVPPDDDELEVDASLDDDDDELELDASPEDDDDELDIDASLDADELELESALLDDDGDEPIAALDDSDEDAPKAADDADADDAAAVELEPVDPDADDVAEDVLVPEDAVAPDDEVAALVDEPAAPEVPNPMLDVLEAMEDPVDRDVPWAEDPADDEVAPPVLADDEAPDKADDAWLVVPTDADPEWEFEPSEDEDAAALAESVPLLLLLEHATHHVINKHATATCCFIASPSWLSPTYPFFMSPPSFRWTTFTGITAYHVTTR